MRQSAEDPLYAACEHPIIECLLDGCENVTAAQASACYRHAGFTVHDVQADAARVQQEQEEEEEVAIAVATILRR